MSFKKWVVSELNKEQAAKISEELNLPFFLATMLTIRGMTEPSEMEGFLNIPSYLSDPFQLKDMDKAVLRIQAAVDGFEKIAVYGDYDADGVTATAALYSYLESCGADVLFYIPEREDEGYGLNLKAIDTLSQQGVGLIITVDNGISSIREVEYANSLHMDVVVTDHHQPGETLPAACAVVDPHRKDCPSSFKDYAGVGVVFKLITALEGEGCDIEGLLANYADLAAIGTIGDVVPLKGENRVLVAHGLRHISNADRIGIKAILEQAGMDGRRLTAGNISFTIVPRINATGRIGSSTRSVQLLLSEDAEEAQRLSAEMCDDNKYRQQLEAQILAEAVSVIEKDPTKKFDRVIVVQGRDWHFGVIGIVAARLVEKYGRPCMVVSVTEQEAKGSGRSIQGFNLFEAITSCADLMTKFGGHPMAAGLSMPPENTEEFNRRINEYAAALDGGMPDPVIKIDCKLNPAALSPELAEQISYLEPFGSGNPTPVFGLYGMKLDKITPVGGNRHLRLQFSREGTPVTCMYFGVCSEDFPYEPGDMLDLAVTLERSEYRGETSLSVFIKEIKLSATDPEKALSSFHTYEKVIRHEPLNVQELNDIIPSREEFAQIYRYIRSEKGWNHDPEILCRRIGCESITPGKLLTALSILAELGLISLKQNGFKLQVEIADVSGKVDLESSNLLSGLSRMRKESN